MTEIAPDNSTIAPFALASQSSPRVAGSGRFWALIPCAGRGTRTGSALPKQYQPVAGRALVLHTLAAFAGVPRLAHTLVLLAPHDGWFAQLDLTPTPGCSAVECGGTTRAGTVTNGLAALRARGAADQDWVLVHDAARCLVTPALIERLIDACRDDPVGGLLATPASDTVKRVAADRVAQTVDRSLYWLAQTPQMFRLAALEHAMHAAGDSVTDESSAIEAQGQAPRLVPGERANFKVTVAQDFILAEAMLLARARTTDEEGPR
ncbi:MAG: 2-C-methyl-D-erythritol 4-phosphate cytidylyltransferase [Burkholderiaceae bacterium]